MAKKRARDVLLDTYFKEIDWDAILTQDEEVELFKKIEIADTAQKELRAARERNILLEDSQKITLAKLIGFGMEAIQKIIESHLPLVVSVAKKYTSFGSPGLDFHDLIQEGNLILCEKVRKFDWRKGARFCSYANQCIIRSIQAALLNQMNTIRIPNYMGVLIKDYRRIKNKLSAELGRMPFLEEIAEKMELSVKQLKKIERFSMNTVSLTDIIENESLMYTVVNESLRVGDVENKKVFKEALSALSNRQRIVLSLSFGLEDDKKHTREEIGEILKLTREKVGQIQNDALEELRDNEEIMKLIS